MAAATASADMFRDHAGKARVEAQAFLALAHAAVVQMLAQRALDPVEGVRDAVALDAHRAAPRQHALEDDAGLVEAQGRDAPGEDHELDARLVAYDVRASIAHARMLADRDLLSREDCDAICAGLTALGEAHARGEWAIAIEEEDAHSALE